MNFNSVLASFVAQLNNAVKVKKAKKAVCFTNSFCAQILHKLIAMGFISRVEEVPEKRLGLVPYVVHFAHIKTLFLNEVKLVTKPGRRVYVGVDQIDKSKGNCFYKAILTTNKGVLSCQECKKSKIGGELVMLIR